MSAAIAEGYAGVLKMLTQADAAPTVKGREMNERDAKNAAAREWVHRANRGSAGPSAAAPTVNETDMGTQSVFSNQVWSFQQELKEARAAALTLEKALDGEIGLWPSPDLTERFESLIKLIDLVDGGLGQLLRCSSDIDSLMHPKGVTSPAEAGTSNQ